MEVFDDVKTRVLYLIREAEIFETDPESLLDKDLFEESLIDSLTMTQIRALIEDEFGCPISEKEFVENLHSINDVIQFIVRNTEHGYTNSALDTKRLY